ncbi:MAG: class I SAM-dependent methyltransferase [Gemmatimonadales bacterium]
MADSPITHVSDTARWVAVYRAMETERPDAIFNDPYARRLAGPEGEEIVRRIPKGRQMSWPMVVRTALMDDPPPGNREPTPRPGAQPRGGARRPPMALDLPPCPVGGSDHEPMLAYKTGAMAAERVQATTGPSPPTSLTPRCARRPSPRPPPAPSGAW